MKIKTNVKGKLPAKGLICLSVGRRISNMECGLGYAAQGTNTGNTGQIFVGLQVAARFSKEVEDSLPDRARQVRAIRKGADKLHAELQAHAEKAKGKKNKLPDANWMDFRKRIAALNDKTRKLYDDMAIDCARKK